MSGPSFDEMQRGELDWWVAFLARNDALARLFAIYGYRYLPWFFEEFNKLGQVIDYGSGPVSAAPESRRGRSRYARMPAWIFRQTRGS